MTLDLSKTARQLIIHSAAGEELATFAEWLSADLYSTFVIEQHFRRLAFVAPKLSYCAKTKAHSEGRLRTVFDAECRPRSRFHCFAGTRRVYQRYLLHCGRLASPLRHRRGSVSCAASTLSLSAMSADSPSPPVGSTRTRSRISCREACGLVSS